MMVDESKLNALEDSVTRVIERGEPGSAGDEEIDALARLAAGLRGLPSPHFKARLRAELIAAHGQRPTGVFSTITSGAWFSKLGSMFWSRRQRPFLAAGSSCGLAAGTCCVAGFAANVLGIASAAAVTTFIETWLPYFIALSVAGMAGWLLLMLRDQGITFASVGGTLQQHGLALGASYAAVFGASMVLTMSTGLYG